MDRWRRGLQIALGWLWLLDAALQYQPLMFTRGFATGIVAPAAQGNPAPVAVSVSWAAGMLTGHPVILNAAFATVQLMLGIGLLWRRSVKAALAASVGWSVAVWWFGEALGGVLAGGADPLTGAPGAVILYALAAVLLWPAPVPERASDRDSVATTGLLGDAAARGLWLLLWAALAYLALQPANRAPGAAHDAIDQLAPGEPAGLAGLDHAAAAALTGFGAAFAIGSAVVLAIIACAVFAPVPVARAALVLAVLVAAFYWVIGQNFGAIATGQATDPGSGLPLALLALAYWPRTRTGNRGAGRRRTACVRGSRAEQAYAWVRTALAPALLAVLLAGCGVGAGALVGAAAPTTAPAGTHRMPDGAPMSDSGTGMGSMDHAAQPSAAAAMICSDKTHASLQHSLGLASVPRSTSRWAGGIYTCTYHLVGGDLVVSVQDTTDPTAGRQYFDTVTARLPGLAPIRGLESFGLPGEQNGAGDVLFIKDGKTLLVDATALPAQVGRYQQTPAEVAYALAASIVACWSGH